MLEHTTIDHPLLHGLITWHIELAPSVHKMNSIHSRIRKLRAELGLSLEDLGARAGVSWQAAQQWEKEGGTAPRRKRLARVAQALHTTEQYLLLGSDMPTKDGATVYLSATIASEPLTVHPLSYNRPAWPFVTVELARYLALPGDEREAIERVVRVMVKDAETRAEKRLASNAR